VVAIAVIAVLLASLADSDDTTNTAKPKPGETPAIAKPATLVLRLGGVSVQNTGTPTKLKPPARRALMQATQGYVNNAIMAPLVSGKVSPYAVAFDPGVKASAMRKDRPVLTEARTGAATGRVKASATPVRFDVLGDPTGKIAFAATSFTMKIKVPTAKGPVNIRRRTELTFANEFGKWRVTAYRVSVRRTMGARTASASASAESPTGVAT
jgi:hypothetical protein